MDAWTKIALFLSGVGLTLFFFAAMGWAGVKYTVVQISEDDGSCIFVFGFAEAYQAGKKGPPGGCIWKKSGGCTMIFGSECDLILSKSEGE